MKHFCFIVIMALISSHALPQGINYALPSAPLHPHTNEMYLLKDGKLLVVNDSTLTEMHRDCTFTQPERVMRSGMYAAPVGQTVLLPGGDFMDFDGRRQGHQHQRKQKIDPRINPSQNRFSAAKIFGDSLPQLTPGYKPFAEMDYYMEPITPAQ